MNSFKTALCNIKKNSRDYSVYFMTLIMGVAVFYMFNSVGSQDFMSTITSSRSAMLQSLITIIDFISVGVALILGLLMVYANHFLIRRRKKEFGVYLMLGMGKRKVSGILAMETIIMGMFSLGVGLGIGVFGSQLLSIIVGKLFEADLTAYRFSFSGEILLKTVLYFCIIFFVVLLFNTKTLAKYKLIDLLHAKKKAEKKLIRNPKGSAFLFLLSVTALVFCYVEIGFYGRTQTFLEFSVSVAAGFAGTFLFFISLSGFLPEILKKWKPFYFDRLNAFVVSQFCHNINSSAISFAVISLMLFLAICAFSVGFSMNAYLNNRLKNATPVDVSAEYLGGTVSELLSQNGYETEAVMQDYYEMPVYYSKYITIRSSVEAVFDKAQSVFLNADWDAADNVVRLSDYNRIEALYGREPIRLSDTEYAVICDFDMLAELTNEAIQKGNTISVRDSRLTCGYDACIEEFVLMSGMNAAMGVIIIPDEIIEHYPEEFQAVGSVLCGNYKCDDGNAVFQKIFDSVTDKTVTAQFSTKDEVTDKCIGTSVSVVFVVLYIGIVFIIISAAVIAVKVLADSMDSVEKYRILARIGAGNQMRKKALFSQIILNFLMPLLLGLLHAVFALKYAKNLLRAVGLTKMFGGTIIAVCVMVLIYGGYFFLTYEACRRIAITADE